MGSSSFIQTFAFVTAKMTLLIVSTIFLAACSHPTYSLTANPTAYVRDSPIEYYLFLPSGYVPEKDWPLFVGVHSFGGDGIQCLEMWQSYAESEGFVLVCPSLADEHGGWYVDLGEKNLDEIIRQVRNDCRVQKQVFLAGFSAGAEFVQAYAFDHLTSVKAVAVLSSGNYYEPPSASHTIPFLVVIGDQDDPIGLQRAKRFAESLKQNGYPIELDILPGVGHEITPQAMELTMRLYNRIYENLP
jgi:pimeloyl-ACP methyl ester carboxylesterase